MILMNDFKAESAQLRDAMLDAVRRVLDSGWYILGQEVLNFEKSWADCCGVKHGVGVGNGMDALEISLRALNIGPGDEVITTPMTAFATVLAIMRAGASPVLADIDPETALMSLESAKRCLSPKTKAVVLVHLYGQIRDMDRWTQFCEERELFLIEDCAQAHLSSLRGRFAGSFGVTGAFSFYPTKNLGALGDAGMIVTDDHEVANHAARLRNYGQSERYRHPDFGLNSRLDEIHAAMLAVRLKWLRVFTARRQEIAEAYQIGIENVSVRPLAESEERAAHVYHLYVVKSRHRSALQNHLHQHGVQSLIHYPVPIHHQPPCIKIQRDPMGLISSELHSEQCLSLPCHPQMTDSDITHVIN